jgi:hypothetical protein
MHNQHAQLSQTLADQHITQLREHATRQRLLATANPPTPAQVVAPPPVAAPRPPARAADQLTSHPPNPNPPVGRSHVQAHTGSWQWDECWQPATLPV